MKIVGEDFHIYSACCIFIIIVVPPRTFNPVNRKYSRDFFTNINRGLAWKLSARRCAHARVYLAFRTLQKGTLREKESLGNGAQNRICLSVGRSPPVYRFRNSLNWRFRSGGPLSTPAITRILIANARLPPNLASATVSRAVAPRLPEPPRRLINLLASSWKVERGKIASLVPGDLWKRPIINGSTCHLRSNSRGRRSRVTALSRGYSISRIVASPALFVAPRSSWWQQLVVFERHGGSNVASLCRGRPFRCIFRAFARVHVFTESYEIHATYQNMRYKNTQI